MLGLDKKKDQGFMNFGTYPPKLALLTATYYSDLSDALLEQAKSQAKANGATYDVIPLPGLLDLAPALAILTTANKYEGFVVLGGAFHGENGEEVLYQESLRALTSLSAQGIPIGISVLWAENKKKLLKLVSKRTDVGGAAVRASLELVALRRDIHTTNAKSTTFRPDEENIIMAEVSPGSSQA